MSIEPWWYYLNIHSLKADAKNDAGIFCIKVKPTKLAQSHIFVNDNKGAQINISNWKHSDVMEFVNGNVLQSGMYNDKCYLV